MERSVQVGGAAVANEMIGVGDARPGAESGQGRARRLTGVDPAPFGPINHGGGRKLRAAGCGRGFTGNGGTW